MPRAGVDLVDEDLAALGAALVARGLHGPQAEPLDRRAGRRVVRDDPDRPGRWEAQVNRGRLPLGHREPLRTDLRQGSFAPDGGVVRAVEAHGEPAGDVEAVDAVPPVGVGRVVVGVAQFIGDRHPRVGDGGAVGPGEPSTDGAGGQRVLLDRERLAAGDRHGVGGLEGPLAARPLCGLTVHDV